MLKLKKSQKKKEHIPKATYDGVFIDIEIKNL